MVDAYEPQSENLLRRHILRLKHLPRTGILRYKNYMRELNDLIVQARARAVAANQEVFSDSQNLDRISRYVEKGQLPWED